MDMVVMAEADVRAQRRPCMTDPLTFDLKEDPVWLQAAGHSLARIAMAKTQDGDR